MEEKVSLYYKDGSSDKEYHAQLVRAGTSEVFVVTFQYGRRNSALATGTKTKTPLPYEEAKKVYDKLVREKMSKGYTPGESGEAFQQTELADRVSGFIPQLLNPMTEAELMSTVNDPELVWQEKIDGERRAIRVDHSATVVCQGANRKGLIVPLPETLAAEMSKLSDCLVDGEILGDRYAVFDLLEYAGQNLRTQGYGDRYAAIEKFLGAGLSGASKAFVVPIAKTAEEKHALLADVKARRGEGVVVKDVRAPYVPGRPNSGGSQRKFKFVASATVEVSMVHHAKRSVAYQCYDEQGRAVPLGNVTIPPNFEVPFTGAIIEVRYLYAYPQGGRLYQPVYLGVRSDQDRAACVLSQLKYKADETEEADVA